MVRSVSRNRSADMAAARVVLIALGLLMMTEAQHNVTSERHRRLIPYMTFYSHPQPLSYSFSSPSKPLYSAKYSAADASLPSAAQPRPSRYLTSAAIEYLLAQLQATRAPVRVAAVPEHPSNHVHVQPLKLPLYPVKQTAQLPLYPVKQTAQFRAYPVKQTAQLPVYPVKQTAKLPLYLHKQENVVDYPDNRISDYQILRNQEAVKTSVAPPHDDYYYYDDEEEDDFDDVDDDVKTQTANPARDSTEEGGTPGRPGVDYPTFDKIPLTNFDCKAQRYKGFFGDPDTRCQVWHYCDLNGGQASFLCPNGTIFSQVGLTCDWWFNVRCANTVQLYVLNERLYKYILPAKPSFPEDYAGPLVDRYLTLKFAEKARQKTKS